MTIAQFRAPSPFTVTQRPSRGSCPTPATNRHGPDFRIDTPLAIWGASPLGRVRIHEASSNKSFPGDTNCNELMTPGTGKLPIGEKDFILGSTFHRRMWPSHDPRRICVNVRASQIQAHMLTGSKEIRVTQCPQSRYPTWCTNKALCLRNRISKAMSNSLRKYGLFSLGRP
jgi:hypothetical protein